MEIFDAIVVGSGFGGSVMTYRLAQAGYKVCLLERGKAYRPGSFPRSPHQAKSNLWDPSEGLHGMFDVWSFRGLDAIVSSGLGGGSLVYANVLKRRPRKLFREEPWPVSYADLEPHYAEVEHVLGATPFPFKQAPYSATRKMLEFRGAAEASRHKFPPGALKLETAKLAVSFGKGGAGSPAGELIDDGRNNRYGVPRLACRLCGECDIGCNYGSKNTLDLNYLTLAERTGNVTILTRCEVKSFKPEYTPDGDRYLVSFVDHSRSRDEPHYIRGKQLILAAGTLGTTYLMLCAQKQGHLPNLSAQLGSNFSGNGDLLTFAWKRHDGVSSDTGGHAVDSSFGPVITTTAAFPNGTSGHGRSLFIQDGGYPNFLSWLLHFGTFPLSLPRILWYHWRAIGKMIWHLVSRQGNPRLSDVLGKLLGGFDFFQEFIPLLGMGQDIADGTFSLRPRKDKRGEFWLNLAWDERASHEHFSEVRRVAREFAHAMGAWHVRFGRIATVHPLGGCPMGEDATTGVVDKNGEVFGYKGLFIADGSVIPSPVGPNPSLTIAALSSLFAEQVIANLGGVRRCAEAAAEHPEHEVEAAAVVEV